MTTKLLDTAFLTTTINLKEIAVGRRLQGRLDPAEIRATFDWLEVVPFRPDHAFAAAKLEAPLHDDEATTRDEANSPAADVLKNAVMFSLY